MADIELVIKISKELYEAYKGRPPMLGDAGMDMIAQAIANGTPLPKGHGRLKDADSIVTEIDRAYPNLDRQDIKQWVFNADTIIEADKESENNE